MMRIFSLTLCAASFLAAMPVEAQTLRLQAPGSSGEPLRAQVGDVVDIEVWANLDSIATSGMAFYLSVPQDAFKIVDARPRQALGMQPFVHGPLFAGAAQISSQVLSYPAPVSEGRQHLVYATIFGPREPRSVKGAGVVASFQLVCHQPLASGEIAIEDDPVRQTRLVLPDSATERRFVSLKGLNISVEDLANISVEDGPTAVGKKAWGQVKATVNR